MKTIVVVAGWLFVTSTAFSAPPDNGVPASEADEWRSIWNTKTGSAWRTKQNELTDEKVSFNPLTGEIWRNPVTDKAEAVLREEWVNDGVEKAKEKAADLLAAAPMDNGIPVSAANQFTSVYNPETSSESRTVRNSVTGQTITFNPQTSELRKSPVTGQWEAIQRESSRTGINDPEFGQKLVNVFNEARGAARNPGVTPGRPATEQRQVFDSQHGRVIGTETVNSPQTPVSARTSTAPSSSGYWVNGQHAITQAPDRMFSPPARTNSGQAGFATPPPVFHPSVPTYPLGH